VRVAVFFLALLPALPGWAEKGSAPAAAVQDADAMFRQAGQSFEAGRYAEAASLYERGFAGGARTAALAYNAGNAEFRLGRRGRSVLWFERAREIDPRDGDILFNLGVARSHLQDGDATAWESLDRALTGCELPWVVVLLSWLVLCLAGAVLWGWVRWERVRWIVLSGGFLLLVSSAWLVVRSHDLSQPWAVVVEQVVEARSGPGENNPVGFTVPEGRRALVTGFRPGWIEIGVPSLGLKGWVREGTVERIQLVEAVK
jgi:hypothetical protein